MPRYRVTLTRTSVEIFVADNPYQAAIIASRGEAGVEVENVSVAVGRPPAAVSRKSASTAPKKAAKKRRPLSSEARAKLAQNLVKARAARAAKARAAKKTSTKRASKKTPKKQVKKR